MTELPKRLPLRLPDYDYSQAGAYFVTVCTQGRKNVFGRIVGAGSPGPSVSLTEMGTVVQGYIQFISHKYPVVSVAASVIMPDHIHLLLEFCPDGPGNPAPTLGTVMGWFKYQTTKEINAIRADKGKLWQRGYYEHVIRNQEDYLSCVEYISQNPAKWLETGH